MATAADYAVNFGYGAQDGYYYGPRGIVGLKHRGNDRPCPTGTPIVISGVTIGLTGATGLVSGPHLHTQACTAGSNYADDFNPGPFEFKSGQVVIAGWHSQFGNRVVIRVGGVDLTYAHLSKINVGVGQQIGIGSDMIPDADNWYYRMDRLMWQIRGRGLSREEFRKNFVGVPTFRMVEVLSDDAEANRALEAQNVGQLAIKDNWQGQIYGLQAQIAELGKNPPKAELDKLNARINELQASSEQATKNAQEAAKRAEVSEAKALELEADKAESVKVGNSFLEWIGSLFKSKEK